VPTDIPTSPSPSTTPPGPMAKEEARRTVIFGDRSSLSRALYEGALRAGAFTVVFPALDGAPAKWETLREILREVSPGVIVNASAADTREEVWQDAEQARARHAVDAERLARLAGSLGATFVHVSSDLVFEGAPRSAHDERSLAAPSGVLSLATIEGERLVEGVLPEALVVRTGCLLERRDTGFAWSLLARLAEGKGVHVGWETMGAPAGAADVAQLIWELVRRGKTGVYHLASGETASWAEFARAAAASLGVSSRLVSTGPRGDLPAWAAPLRPAVLAPRRLLDEGLMVPRAWREVMSEIVLAEFGSHGSRADLASPGRQTSR